MTKLPTKKQNDPLTQYFNNKELVGRKRLIGFLRNFYQQAEKAYKALQEVKERRLYRPYATLQEFCEKECGWTKSRFYQLAKFLEVKSKLPSSVQPLVESERVARELVNIPEEEREHVLTEAAATGKVTAKKIKQLAEKRPKLEDTIIELDATGCKIPEKALIIWNRRHEAEKILDALKNVRDMMAELKAMQAGPFPDSLYGEVTCNTLYASLSMVCTTFKRAIPYAVCTTCQGIVPETCAHCHGRGMISQWSYDHHVKPELKEIRKKAQQHENTYART